MLEHTPVSVTATINLTVEEDATQTIESFSKESLTSLTDIPSDTSKQEIDIHSSATSSSTEAAEYQVTDASTTAAIFVCGAAIVIIIATIVIIVFLKTRNSNKGCFQKASADPSILFETNMRVSPEDMTSEQLTPINGQVVGPSNHSATGDTYCKLNAFELPRPGVYAELVLSGESASAPSYVNIPALEMSLRSDAISSMSPASDALSSTTTTYENTVAKILPAYAYTISAYENVVILQ